MRRWVSCFLIVASFWPTAGCVGELLPGLAGSSDATGLSVPVSTAQPLPSSASVGKADSAAGPRRSSVSGSLSGSLSYDLYSVGPSARGDRWTISPSGLGGGAIVVALFDDQENLLAREYVTGAMRLTHIMRENVGNVQIGVMVPSGRHGGSYRLDVTIQPAATVPSPRRQLVWLNFGGATGVRVNGRAAISFAAFDGAMVGEAYTGHTQALKDAIVASMRADYQDYNVEIVTSDEAPEPTEPHAVIQFGGRSNGLLGLADSVDDYNADLSQTAVVYVENFEPYWTMKLTPDEMGVMIANVASHELGHLLGLYHTQDPTDTMDTTGSAWDLAGSQRFSRARLEPTVFATGMEDSPALLEQIVGLAPPSLNKALAAARVAKIPLYAEIRRFAQAEIPYACGTCLSLDSPDDPNRGY